MLITLLISYSRVGHHDIKAKYYLIPGIKLSEDQSWIIRLSSENYWKLILTETWIVHWRDITRSICPKLHQCYRNCQLPGKYISQISTSKSSNEICMASKGIVLIMTPYDMYHLSASEKLKLLTKYLVPVKWLQSVTENDSTRLLNKRNLSKKILSNIICNALTI